MNNKGNASILLVLLMAVLLTSLSYVIDIGLSYAQRIKLSNAVDSAVLASSRELKKSKTKVNEIAKKYLDINYKEEYNYEITIPDDLKSVEINANTKVNHYFSQVFGNSNSIVHVSAKAIIAPIKSIKNGVKPLAVKNFNFTYGDEIILKEGAGDGENGNYGALALGGNGASIFSNNLENGYDSTISIGDELLTEPGNIVSALNIIKNNINGDSSTFEDYSENSIRLWTVPLIDSFDIYGRDYVVVVGFAEFFVENIDIHAGKGEIGGRFIKYVINGDIDTSLNDKGLYGIKLVK
ncbi:pilus assembly protein TadG-related protein [Helicovermis profundi]|uniref:Putative Flp pilus-assembly TadG-like N-terminal domain-containing protein n=1 Tax=Helicovermis profundi TaxID=3065157 RepID=A0AAU9E1L6_9FIRM|nr:hypothetical protein HLPR_00510 [Clostridia bacterium S502]